MSRKMPCLLALFTTACAGIGNGPRPLAAPSSSPAGSPSAAEPATFTPTTDDIGEETRLVLTFPDGTEATVSYPAQLDLAGMGVQPDVDLLWGERELLWRNRWVGAIVFSHGGPIGGLLEGPKPVTVHALQGQIIEEWLAQPRRGRHSETTRWLVFRLPSWTVHVPLDARLHAAEVIDRVHPFQTDGGFVAIDASPPAHLPEAYGEAGGPKLAFGDREALPDFILPAADRLSIDLAPSKCGPYEPSTEVIGSSAFGSVCLGGALFVNGSSFSDSDTSRRKLAQIIDGLRLLQLEPAS
jgi:hypothetical protein